MSSILIAVLSFIGFIVAYHTYGRYLSRRIFRLDSQAIVPSHEINDGADYVPTRRQVLFGHHFTSIAGTGPIVGPALAVIWGWLPALLWVVFGSILIGAVHDLGALVVSMRSRGQTIGDVAGRMVSPRARLLFLFILFFALTVALAIFGLVIASVFSMHPESVLSVWTAMPLAVLIGFWIHNRGGSLWAPSLLALALLYAATYLPVRYEALQIRLGDAPGVARQAEPVNGAQAEEEPSAVSAALRSPVVLWTLLLLVYCFFASVLPVWMLLQPRDFINSQQLLLALFLMLLGLCVAQPPLIAPAVRLEVPGAPPILPFLFITVACGAISGFHCVVSSGTSSKQLDKEPDALYVGFGGMLLEGALAVLVILACCAGLGLGTADGAAAWNQFYGGSWGEMQSLGATVSAFVKGGANMIAALGISLPFAEAIIAVMVACFVVTSMDTATRLQRYVVHELGAALRIPGTGNKYVATTIALGFAGALALIPGPNGQPGTGGMILWPLFGSINQLLAGLSFLVVAFYLIRHNRPVWFLIGPFALMIVLPLWAMGYQLLQFYNAGNWLLVSVGIAVQILQLWLMAEGALMWRRARGVAPAALPPLPVSVAMAQDVSGRAC